MSIDSSGLGFGRRDVAHRLPAQWTVWSGADLTEIAEYLLQLDRRVEPWRLSTSPKIRKPKAYLEMPTPHRLRFHRPRANARGHKDLERAPQRLEGSRRGGLQTVHRRPQRLNQNCGNGRRLPQLPPGRQPQRCRPAGRPAAGDIPTGVRALQPLRIGHLRQLWRHVFAELDFGCGSATACHLLRTTVSSATPIGRPS